MIRLKINKISDIEVMFESGGKKHSAHAVYFARIEQSTLKIYSKITGNLEFFCDISEVEVNGQKIPAGDLLKELDFIGSFKSGGGASTVTPGDHNSLTGRAASGAHPVSAITGLTGGIAGNVLSKKSNTDGDVEWKDIPAPVLEHNNLTGRSDNDAHPVSSITGLTDELGKKIEDVAKSGIKATNKLDGQFRCAALGQDGKLYFGNNAGIWYRDSDGQIKPTNKIDGEFYCAALGQDGKLYFGGYNIGIWFLDSDGQIKVTNKTDKTFNCAVPGQDGKLYFGSSGSGAWYLDDDGQIKHIEGGNSAFLCIATGQDGKLYFGGNSGAWYLDSNGRVMGTNKTNVQFRCAALGQDGKLYFGGNPGIWYLDSDGQIKATNKTDGAFYFAAFGQNGKLYFCGFGGTGIWYLDDDGQIKPTNKTDGEFYCAALGQDGKLYFGSTAGIWYLDSDGQVKATNKMDGIFHCATLGQDGKLYFGGYGGAGIWYLEAGTYARENGKWVNISQSLSEIKKIDSKIQTQVGAEAQARAAGDTNTLNTAKTYTDSRIAQIQLPEHYQGQAAAITDLPADGGTKGNYWYVLDLGTTYENHEGSATWNGTGYDIAPDRYNVIDNNTIVKNTVTGEIEVNMDGLTATLSDDAASASLPATASGTVISILNAFRANVKALFSYFTNGIANSAVKLNIPRTIEADDSSTGSASFDGSGDITVGIPVTTTAPAASDVQTAAGTRTLRAQIKILIDNIAHLFENFAPKTYVDSAVFGTMIPDYANMETVNRISTNNGTWTADRDGFVFLSALAAYNGVVMADVVFSVNDKVVYTSSIKTASTSNMFAAPVAVAKGQTVKISSATASVLSDIKCYYIPPKTTILPTAENVAWLPDISAIESTNRITANGGTWTADRDGFINCSIWASRKTGTGIGQMSMKFLINGKVIFNNVVTSNEGQGFLSKRTVQIAKGQTIRMIIDDNTAGDVSSTTAMNNIAFGSSSCLFIPPLGVVPNTMPMQYSTTEQDTGKTWIDGKKIYRKVFTGTITAPANTHTPTILDSSTNIVRLIDSGGFVCLEDNTLQNSYGYISDGIYARASIGKDLILRILSNCSKIRTNAPYEVWCEYTKA